MSIISRRSLLVGIAAAAVVPCAVAAGAPSVFEGPVPHAQCGSGSHSETALSGEVTVQEREDGKSQAGYWCNMVQVGNYAGEGASYQMASYGHCAYYDTKFEGGEQSPGTQVIDVSDPAHPKLTTTLTSVGMLDRWESLKVNEKRGLLAGVGAHTGESPAAVFDVYDVSADCAHPRLEASAPVNVALGHEGNWAPDGKTYYASDRPGSLAAIDVSDPSSPSLITVAPLGTLDHGLSVSDDGNRAYWAMPQLGGGEGNGLLILDVSDIQRRAALPQPRTIATLSWTDGSQAQMTIPVKIDGHPYLVFVDELGNGAARIIDIGDETHPKVIAKLKLDIQLPANQSVASSEASSSFGYNAHYCAVPQRDEPGIVGCSYFESGVRIFDIRDPYHPQEIAYFNPGGTPGPRPGSQRGGGTSGYTSAMVRFVGDQVWFTDQDKGFYATRFTNGAWPFQEPAAAPAGAATGSPADLGLPPLRSCASRRSFRIRLRAPRGVRLRSARVYVNGKRVRVAKGR